jgi:hypothetical protein
MSLGDTLRNVTGPLVKQLANELGSTVTIRKSVSTRNAANETRQSYADRATGVKMIIENLNIFRAQQTWGLQTSVTAQALIPLSDLNADTTPRKGDGLIVTDGMLVGSKFTVSETKPDDLGQNLIAALVIAQDKDI